MISLRDFLHFLVLGKVWLLNSVILLDRQQAKKANHDADVVENDLDDRAHQREGQTTVAKRAEFCETIESAGVYYSENEEEDTLDRLCDVVHLVREPMIRSLANGVVSLIEYVEGKYRPQNNIYRINQSEIVNNCEKEISLRLT